MTTAQNESPMTLPEGESKDGGLTDWQLSVLSRCEASNAKGRCWYEKLEALASLSEQGLVEQWRPRHLSELKRSLPWRLTDPGRAALSRAQGDRT